MLQSICWTLLTALALAVLWAMWNIWSHKQKCGADFIEACLRNDVIIPPGEYVCQRQVFIDNYQVLVIRGMYRDWAGRLVVII